MGLNLIQKLGPFKKPLLAAWRWDACGKFQRIRHELKPGATVLDIGSGYGTVVEVLRDHHFKVTAIDVADQSVAEDLKPIIYDGELLPFEPGTYDYALLLTVLHHTPDPARILAEAARVGRQVIVIEDVYTNPLQQYLTYLTDSLLNFEFRGHPHSNKTRAGWHKTCQSLGLTMKLIRSDRFLLFFRQETYVVSRSANQA
jgi:SAM-dependent methyltransferase